MVIPNSEWYAKQSGYIKNSYINKNTTIVVESILIGVDDAYVTFNIGVKRITMDAIEFRKKFERNTKREGKLENK